MFLHLTQNKCKFINLIKYLLLFIVVVVDSNIYKCWVSAPCGDIDIIKLF